MNLILLDPESTLDAGQYALTDRQQTHVTKVIKAQAGDVLRVGVLNGKIGDGVYEPPSGDPVWLYSFIEFVFARTRPIAIDVSDGAAEAEYAEAYIAEYHCNGGERVIFDSFV